MTKLYFTERVSLGQHAWEMRVRSVEARETPKQYHWFEMAGGGVGLFHRHIAKNDPKLALSPEEAIAKYIRDAKARVMLNQIELKQAEDELEKARFLARNYRMEAE